MAMIAGALSALPAARAAAGRDWPEYLGGPDRGHYSLLHQIDTSNVSRLRTAWVYHTGEFGQMQCNPIVVKGVLYGATGTSEVFALDAASGRPIWRFNVPGKLDVVLANDRGVTYWTDGRSERILCTIDSWLYALDARTGAVIRDFGAGGRASLRAGLGPQAQRKWVMSTTPGVPPSEMMPERVCVVPAGGLKNGSPEIVMLLAMVKLPVPRNDSVVPAASDTFPVPSALLLPTTSVPPPTVVPPE